MPNEHSGEGESATIVATPAAPPETPTPPVVPDPAPAPEAPKPVKGKALLAAAVDDLKAVFSEIERLTGQLSQETMDALRNAVQGVTDAATPSK